LRRNGPAGIELIRVSDMILLTRKAEFSAAHYYWNDRFSAEENERVFGKCANRNGHGHNYTLEVTVAGEVDPVTGFVVDLKLLKEILEREVVGVYDHRHLNLEILVGARQFRRRRIGKSRIALHVLEKTLRIPGEGSLGQQRGHALVLPFDFRQAEGMQLRRRLRGSGVAPCQIRIPGIAERQIRQRHAGPRPRQILIQQKIVQRAVRGQNFAGDERRHRGAQARALRARRVPHGLRGLDEHVRGGVVAQRGQLRQRPLDQRPG